MIDTKYIEKILKPLLEVINSKVPEIQEYLLDNMLPVEQFEKDFKHRPGIYVFFIKPKCFSIL